LNLPFQDIIRGERFALEKRGCGDEVRCLVDW